MTKSLEDYIEEKRPRPSCPFCNLPDKAHQWIARILDGELYCSLDDFQTILNDEFGMGYRSGYSLRVHVIRCLHRRWPRG